MTLQSLVLVIDILIASLDANVLTMITHDCGHGSQYHVELIMKSLNQSASARPWSRTVTAWWTGHWLQPAASCRPAAVRGEPEFKFSSGPSSDSWAGPACTLCTLVHCVSAGSGRDCTTVRGLGLGAGTSDQSGYSDRVESTQSVLPSVLLQSESPAQGSVHQLAPVLACSELTCVRPLRAQKLEVKIS